MNGWTCWQDEYASYVYDCAYNDLVALCLDAKKKTLRVENVTLDMRGVENLRKKLQQVERYAKQYP